MKDNNIIIFTLPRRFIHRSPTTSRLRRVNFSVGGYPVPKFIPIYRELSGLRGASFLFNLVRKSKPLYNQAQYWDTILDPQNISAQPETISQFNLETEIAFYRTPAQEYAYTLMNSLSGKKILELGGGLGVNAVILARAGAQVTVLDISENRVEWMKRLAKQIQLQERINVIQMSAEQLSFPENSFDIVYSNAVLIHVNIVQVVKEAYRVLKPGGKAIFVEPLKYHPLVNLYRYTFAPRIWRNIAHYFSFRDIDELGKQFTQYTHQEFYLFSFLSFFWEFGWRNLSRFPRSLSCWMKIDEKLLRLFPSFNKLCWFTVFCGTK